MGVDSKIHSWPAGNQGLRLTTVGVGETPGMGGLMPGTVIKRRLDCEETQGVLRNHGFQKRKGPQISAKAGKLTSGLWAQKGEVRTETSRCEGGADDVGIVGS